MGDQVTPQTFYEHGPPYRCPGCGRPTWLPNDGCPTLPGNAAALRVMTENLRVRMALRDRR